MKNISLTFLSIIMVSQIAYASLENSKLEQLNSQKIEQLTRLKGQFDEKENVFKVSMPRTDLNINVAGVKLTPPMGLTAWAAFKKGNAGMMVMGDLVLLEDQVNSVMSVALANGLNITALHNHFFWDKPKVMFMHIHGMGDETQIATAVGKVFDELKATSNSKGKTPTANIDPSKTTLDPKKIEAILNTKGSLKDGVYKVVFGRTAKMGDDEIGNAMGVNTWAAFAGSDDNAVVDGDFAMHESELQNVLIALRQADINIVAIHQHMTGEQPRIMFLHFWGLGNTAALAKGLRDALEKTH